MEQSPRVEVRRSRRRRRTVSAYRDADGTVVVLLPARLTQAEERQWVQKMVARLDAQERRRSPSDEALAQRAARLSERYLQGLARPDSVRWVDNQQHRWGSCTPADRSIRLSSRLKGMPTWVIDYVLLHELAHLLEKRHSEAFWRMVDQLPKAERAKGFLEGVAATAGLEMVPDDAEDIEGDPGPESSAAAEAPPGLVEELVE